MKDGRTKMECREDRFWFGVALVLSLIVVGMSIYSIAVDLPINNRFRATNGLAAVSLIAVLHMITQSSLRRIARKDHQALLDKVERLNRASEAEGERRLKETVAIVRGDLKPLLDKQRRAGMDVAEILERLQGEEA